MRRAAVGPDDVAFVSDLLDAVSTRLCVDPRRVFATGISDGADMANTVACALPDRVAAVAPVAPSVLPDRVAAVAPVAPSVLPEGCATPAPSLLEIHGTADRIVPYLGGGPDRPPPFQGTRAQPAEQRLARWAALVGCRGRPTWTGVTGSVRFLRWGCGPGRDVGLLAVAAGGHTWPGAAPDPTLGPTTGEISANRVILLFFRGHPQLRAA
ncbi:MAG TPA: PHB depolymerase family esterase [Frankiaceae bacterium]|nr:PHB depolymerase family esterase [Frankiaceae bacterium]